MSSQRLYQGKKEWLLPALVEKQNDRQLAQTQRWK
jgi:hypothetical protein